MLVRQRWKLLGLLVLLILFVLLTLIIRSPYYINLITVVGMNAILAMTFIITLRTGLITMATAAFWGVGAYSSAMLVMKVHLSFWLALPMSVIIAGVIALGLGVILLRSAGLSFVIMTLVIGSIFPLAIGGTTLFGGYGGIVSIPPVNPIHIPFLPPIEFVSNTTYYYLMLFLIVVVIAVYYAFYSSSIGMAWKAIGLNSQLAQSLGINVFRYRLLAFVLASATAGLVGSFYAHWAGSLLPNQFDVFKTIYIQVYAILGGTVFPFLGPIVGSAVWMILSQIIGIPKEIQPLLIGALLILLIIFLPSGILSLPGLRAMATNPVESVAKISNAIKSSLSSRRGARKV
jgi:branched-chain amino acid transport system permease protein